MSLSVSRVRWSSLLSMTSTRVFLNRMYCGARDFRHSIRREGQQTWRRLKNTHTGSNVIIGEGHYLRTSLQNRSCSGGKKAVEEGLKAAEGVAASSSPTPPEKQTLLQKFKAMYKDYYYVLIPVHVVTSVGWLGTFYQVSKSGMDIAGYMRKMGFSDGIISKITESGMGHVAVAYALYKIATPARYTVTLGGTTWAINRLTRMGYIKPAKEIISQGKQRLKNLKPEKK